MTSDLTGRPWSWRQAQPNSPVSPRLTIQALPQHFEQPALHGGRRQGQGRHRPAGLRRDPDPPAADPRVQRRKARARPLRLLPIAARRLVRFYRPLPFQVVTPLHVGAYPPSLLSSQVQRQVDPREHALRARHAAAALVGQHGPSGVLAGPWLASTGSSDCISRLGAALRTRGKRPSTSDPSGRPCLSS